MELLSAYLIVCLVGNQMSILLPVNCAARFDAALRTPRCSACWPASLAMLGQLVAFVPLVIPIGVDYLIHQFSWGQWIPAYLIISLLMALVLLFVYRNVLEYQGGLLQRRELRILEAVTAKED